MPPRKQRYLAIFSLASDTVPPTSLRGLDRVGPFASILERTHYYYSLTRYHENVAKGIQTRPRSRKDYSEEKSYLYGRQAQDLKSHSATRSANL